MKQHPMAGQQLEVLKLFIYNGGVKINREAGISSPCQLSWDCGMVQALYWNDFPSHVLPFVESEITVCFSSQLQDAWGSYIFPAFFRFLFPFVDRVVFSALQKLGV